MIKLKRVLAPEYHPDGAPCGECYFGGKDILPFTCINKGYRCVFLEGDKTVEYIYIESEDGEHEYNPS